MTTYAGVTATGLSIHDLAQARSSSKSSECLFDRDFALKNNTSKSIDLSYMYSLVNRRKYRLKIVPNVVSMSNYFILVLISHFLNGLQFLLDPAFLIFSS